MAKCGGGHEQDDSRLGEICPKCYITTHEELAAAKLQVAALRQYRDEAADRHIQDIDEINLLRSKLRDEFAAAALTGILSCYREHVGYETVPLRCKLAFQYADEIMKLRGK